MYLVCNKGYTMVGFERVNFRTYKIKLKVIREKDTKLIEIKGPDYDSSIEILNIVIDILDKINNQREDQEKLYLEEIVYIEPSYNESLLLEGYSTPPYWHIYLIDGRNRKYLVLFNKIPEDIEEGIRKFEFMHDLNF